MIVCASCRRPESKHTEPSAKKKISWDRIKCRRDEKGRLALTSTRA